MEQVNPCIITLLKILVIYTFKNKYKAIFKKGEFEILFNAIFPNEKYVFTFEKQYIRVAPSASLYFSREYLDAYTKYIGLAVPLFKDYSYQNFSDYLKNDSWVKKYANLPSDKDKMSGLFQNQYDEIIEWAEKKYKELTGNEVVPKQVKEQTAHQNILIDFKKYSQSLTEINNAYWESKHKQALPKAEIIRELFYLKANAIYTHDAISLELEKSDRVIDLPFEFYNYDKKSEEEYSIKEIITNAFKKSSPVLIKVLAPSGEGKTVFLGKIAYEYSQAPENNSVVYYLTGDLDEGVISQIQTLLNLNLNPILLIIDTPSDHASILLESFEKVCINARLRPFIVLIADQDYRYHKKLKTEEGKMFDDYFSGVITIPFKISKSEHNTIFNNVCNIIQASDDIKDRVLRSIYFFDSSWTTRERIYRILRQIKEHHGYKHTQDWDIWTGLTKDSDYERLFSFVAFFSYFDIEIPLNLFSNEYIDDVDVFDVLGLLKNTYEGSIINIVHDGENSVLKLRHEHIAKWYYEDENRTDEAIATFNIFLNRFKEKLDLPGCYLFRNIQKQIGTSNIKVIDRQIVSSLGKKIKLSDSERKNILNHFLEFSESLDRESTKKVMMQLSELSIDFNEKIEWLDRIIEKDEDDYYARYKKALLFFKNPKYLPKARSIVNELLTLKDSSPSLLRLLYNLDVAEGMPINANKYLEYYDANHKFKVGLITVAVNLMGGSIEQLKKALQILNHIIYTDNKEKIARMMVARIHFGDVIPNISRAIELCKELNEIDKEYSDAYLLLSDYYYRKGDIENAVNILKGVKLKGVYSRLAKLYRSSAYKGKYKIEGAIASSEALFEEIFKEGLGLSSYLRVEYAKWLHDSFTDKNMHEKAEGILKEILIDYPINIPCRVELALLYTESKFYVSQERFLEAKELLEKGILYDRYNKEIAIRVVLGKTYIKLNTDEYWIMAKSILEEAEKIKQTLSVMTQLFRVYHHFSDIENMPSVINFLISFHYTDSSSKMFIIDLIGKNGFSDAANKIAYQ